MLYADDAILYTTGSNIADIQNKLQILLDTITYWTNMNKLNINASKTTIILFSR